MKYGEKILPAEMRVGQVVRIVHGPVMGGAEDFRQSFDSFLVARVGKTSVTLYRPFRRCMNGYSLWSEEAIFSTDSKVEFEVLQEASSAI